jgi:hypothetical protein
MRWSKLLLLVLCFTWLGCHFDRGGISAAPEDASYDVAHLDVADRELPDVELPDAGVDADSQDACVVTNGGVEACDSIDNDCDSLTDEDFDLQNDPNNCGICGRVCNLPHAVSTCENADCAVFDCDREPTYGYHTWWDNNQDPADGCEYGCLVSWGGHDLCDGVDNDCDGQTDENCSSLVLYFGFGDPWTLWPDYVYDLSGNFNDGVAIGGALHACSIGDAVPGENMDNCAAEFNGIDGYIEVAATASLDITGAITVMGWLKTTELNNIIITRGTSSANHTWSLRTYDGHTRFAWADGFVYSVDDILDGVVNLTDGDWHHVAAVGDPQANMMYIYVDGQLDNSKPKSTVPSSIIIESGVGHSIGFALYTEGTIDEVSVHNRALSATEIADRYYRLHYEFLMP